MADQDEILVGVLLANSLPGVQMLDFGAVDILNNATPSYISMLSDIASKEVVANALNFNFLWITDKTPGSSYSTTGQASIKTTHSLETAPQLDFLLIPGPEPDYKLSQQERDFIHRQLKGLTALLSVCTGITLLLQAGICKGKLVSGPRPLQPMYEKLYPETKFGPRRWEVDSLDVPGSAAKKVGLKQFDRSKHGIEFWSSGGVLNGLDMIAAFLRSKFPASIAEWAISTADAPGRSQEYSN